MLLAQSAIADHSVEHALHDSSESCQIYIGAEASKLLTSPSLALVAVFIPQVPYQLFDVDIPITQRVSHSARGPPLRTLI